MGFYHHMVWGDVAAWIPCLEEGRPWYLNKLNFREYDLPVFHLEGPYSSHALEPGVDQAFARTVKDLNSTRISAETQNGISRFLYAHLALLVCFRGHSWINWQRLQVPLAGPLENVFDMDFHLSEERR